MVNQVGIAVQSSNNTVGGTTTGARNVIGICGFAAGSGIQIIGGFGTPTSGNVVRGNYIGTDANGNPLGSTSGAGIVVVADTENNVIGGTGAHDDNLIRGMGGGIAMVDLQPITEPLNNTVIGNSIYENDGGFFTGLGIDLLETPDFGMTLVSDGVTANDAGDSDTGTNDYLNFPVLDSTDDSTGELNVQFDLDVPALGGGVTGYRIDFYANDNGDSSGNGEGQYYLGSANVSGDVTNHTETITLPPGVIETGTYDISATTTEIDGSDDGFGATSEFSALLNNQHITAPVDNDGDGIADSIEDAGPNGGDANDDGTPDSDQANVATIENADGDNYLTLELTGDCDEIDEFIATTESDQAEADDFYKYPLGLNSFTVSCEEAEGTIYYHEVENFNAYDYRKFGPTTPGDASTNAWYDSGFTVGTATVGSNQVATASFSLTDGELGDDTGDNGVIRDDNGPGLLVNGGSNENESGNNDSANGDNDLAATGYNQSAFIVFGLLAIAAGTTGLLCRKQLSALLYRRQ